MLLYPIQQNLEIIIFYSRLFSTIYKSDQQILNQIIIQMQGQNFQLRNGNHYLLINKKSKLALQLPESDNPRKQSIITSKPNELNLNQIWMIEEIKPNEFQIVHFASTLVLQNDHPQLKLHFGNWKRSQIFSLKKFNPKNCPNQYQIKDSKEQDSLNYVFFENELKCKERDNMDLATVWELLLVFKNPEINRSCFIQYAYSGMVLDVPQASEKQGQKIIQYNCNRRHNQKWILIKQGDHYLIQNSKSKQYLDIKGQSQKEGAHIIQWKHNGNKNQLWSIEEQGKRLYLIRSALNNQLLLGIEGSPYKEGAYVATTKNEGEAFWRIVGGQIP